MDVHQRETILTNNALAILRLIDKYKNYTPKTTGLQKTLTTMSRHDAPTIWQWRDSVDMPIRARWYINATR